MCGVARVRQFGCVLNIYLLVTVPRDTKKPKKGKRNDNKQGMEEESGNIQDIWIRVCGVRLE